LYLLASALRRGSRQPGSRCTRAAAIRSASTPAPADACRPSRPASARPEDTEDADDADDAVESGAADCTGIG
jgi:hypothetical protein